MPNYNYYLGPWQASDGGWIPPPGTVGLVDLASVGQCALSGGDSRPVGFFAVAGVLDADYALLGRGDCRELAATAYMADAFESLAKYRPQGDRLVDLLWDTLTTGSDPAGDASVMPLVPTMGGSLELHLGGHSCVKAERFEFGRHRHTEKIRDMVTRRLDRVRVQALDGKRRPGRGEPDRKFHRRVLMAYLEKYRIKPADWEQIKPRSWGRDEGPLEHSTTYADDFNRANGVLSSPWAFDTTGTFSVSGNQVICSGTFVARQGARYESDLASDDHFSQINAVATSGNDWTGPCARYSSSARTHYNVQPRSSTYNDCYVYKCVSGTFTSLQGNGWTAAFPSMHKIAADGSTIQATVNGTAMSAFTDTAIASNTRGGFCARAQFGSTSDDWSCGDLVSFIPAWAAQPTRVVQ